MTEQFFNLDGEVFSFNTADLGWGQYIPAGAVPISRADADLIRNLPMPAERLIEKIRAAVQAHVDTTARTRLYDNGNSLASYVASTNPQWAAEAQAFVAWRDAVWSQVYALWASPPEPWPTPETVIADLPAISWPA